MTVIHPTACIDSKAELGQGVEIGPNCCVGPHAILGDHTRLHNNVTVVGKTTLANGNELFPGAVLGAAPQDLKYKGGLTTLVVGNDNVFRENVTAHVGTEIAGGQTRIGNHNQFMVGAHIAHDVIVGNGCILPNYLQIAGHCHIEDCATMGGMVGVHHFCTIGRLSYTAGLTRVTIDVPPFMVFGGDPGRVRGVNANGMERWGMPGPAIQAIRQAYKELFSRRSVATGLTLSERLARVEHDSLVDSNLKVLVDSVRRSLVNGVHGRYLESCRTDGDVSRGDFYQAARQEASRG